MTNNVLPLIISKKVTLFGLTLPTSDKNTASKSFPHDDMDHSRLLKNMVSLHSNYDSPPLGPNSTLSLMKLSLLLIDLPPPFHKKQLTFRLLLSSSTTLPNTKSTILLTTK